jgi:serine/threonine protein phosphatase 1
MSATVKTYVQRYTRNLRGSDYVASDIHGCFSSLKFALERVGFSPACDRLFCVGDLVDRGPESHMVPGLLAQPWFNSIRGNHEDLILEAGKGDYGPSGAGLKRKGALWLEEMDPEFRQRLVQRLADLPIVLEIETETGIVGLVHGDVPLGLSWEEFKAGLATPKILDCALNGRDRVLNESEAFIEGVSRVYLGHTRVVRPLVLGNCCAIDTGAASRGGDASGYSVGVLTVLDVSIPLEDIAARSFADTAVEDVFTAGR